jgi:hypothetical protein
MTVNKTSGAPCPTAVEELMDTKAAAIMVAIQTGFLIDRPSTN